jgi:HlyD family secretion protein
VSGSERPIPPGGRPLAGAGPRPAPQGQVRPPSGRRSGVLLPPAGPGREISYSVAEAVDLEPRDSLRKPLIWGAVAIAIGFGGFFGWAASASLDSAAVATGTVTVDTKRKTVTHLEGGILKRLLVREGDAVKQGQLLLEMDDLRARADLSQFSGKRVGLLAKLARLRAEQTNEPAIDFPAELRDSADPIAVSVVRAESDLFRKRRQVYEGKLEFQRKQIEQYSAEAESLLAKMQSTTRQRDLVATRLEAVRKLSEKGYASKAQLVEIEATWNGLIGSIGEYTAQKAKAEQAKAGALVSLLSVEQEWQSQVASDLQDAQLLLNEVEQQIASAQDVLSRLGVRAPQSGVVVDIKTRTPGGVIPPGQPIMDIVPENEPLLIESRLNLRDIVSVHVGSKARIRLTSYDNRTLAPVAGEVTYVAADQTVDQTTGVAYFIVRARILPEELSSHPEVKLYPGMPAELLVINRPRKAIDYLIEPITESFNRAFREN